MNAGCIHFFIPFKGNISQQKVTNKQVVTKKLPHFCDNFFMQLHTIFD